jgi:hypothetical protein
MLSAGKLADLADEAHVYLRRVSDGTSPICVPVLYEDKRVASAMDEARGDLFKAMALVHRLLEELETAEKRMKCEEPT